MNKRVVIAVSLSLAVVAVVAFFRLSKWQSRGGEEAPLYSTMRYDPYGTAALKELLHERGIKTSTLNGPRPTQKDRGVLIQTPYYFRKGAWGRFNTGRGLLQTQALREWITAGNTVIQLTRGESALLRDFLGKKEDDEMEGCDPCASAIQEHEERGRFPHLLPGEIVEARWVYDIWADMGKSKEEIGPLILRSPLALAALEQDIGFIAAEQWRPLAESDGNIVAIEFKVGKGRFIAVGAPTPVLNGDIEKGGNLDFLLWAIGDGPVIFDEWSHGVGRYGTIMGLMKEAHLVPVLLQIGFILAIYIWSTMGQKKSDRVEAERRRASIEQVETLGHLYSGAFSSAEVFRRVRQEAFGRMAKALRCPPSDVNIRLKEIGPTWKNLGQSIITLVNEPRAMDNPAKVGLSVAQKKDFENILTLSHQFEKGVRRERRLTGRIRNTDRNV